MKFFNFLVITLALAAAVLAQEETTTEEVTEPPTDPPTEETTTAEPGRPYGAICNGVLARCNRHQETVACFSSRADPPTTPEPTEEPTTEEPPVSTDESIMSLFGGEAPQEVCSTGTGVVLGRCLCSRNCKDGHVVEDGHWDETREVCVGLAQSTCSGFFPWCTDHATCNFLTSKCVCQSGYEADENRRCVPKV